MDNKIYHPTKILSDNSKTGASINLPIIGHCTPTKNCAKSCYAKTGPCTWKNSTRKQIWVSNYLAGKNIQELIKETRRKTAVRLSGTGDLNPQHLPNLFSLAVQCPDTMLWGMTRKTDLAKEINGRYPNLKLLVSVDASSPSSVWNYQGALCYGPRLPEDTVPKDSRIHTIFPLHIHGKVKDTMPAHPKDCQAVYHRISGCMECGRCWKW
jgi:hypothetical protein